MKKIAVTILAGFMGGLSSIALYNYFKPQNEQTALVAAPPVHYTSQLSAPPEAGVNFTTAAELTINSVVHIKTIDYNKRANSYDPFRDFFFGNPYQQRGPVEGMGSGVIISEDGYVVTNNHVIDKADKIEVTLNDKRSYTAKVIGTDPATDLALIQIEEKGLPFVQFANSDQVKVGEWVLAVGNPFNLNSTVTAGIVSAKTRKIDIIHKDLAIESFIQTDAAVNPGNSGGALVNTYGELVGINSAIASNTGSYTGYSFAIPSNLVRKVVNDLAEYGKVQRAFLGVTIRDINADFAKSKGIDNLKGVYVDDITLNGSAAEAGIKKGDVIRKVGDIEVHNFTGLQEQIGNYRPGDNVAITVQREKEVLTIPVKLKNKDGSTTLFKRNDELLNMMGANFEEFTNTYGNIQGLKVTKITSGKFKSVGIKEGFLVLKVNGKPVKTKDDLVSILSESDNSVYVEGVYPSGEKAYYAFGL